VFCLDTSILYPLQLAWEYFSSYPIVAICEEVGHNNNNINNNNNNNNNNENNSFINSSSRYTPKSISLVKDKLESPIEKRLSNCIMIFNTVPFEGIDYDPIIVNNNIENKSNKNNNDNNKNNNIDDNNNKNNNIDNNNDNNNNDNNNNDENSLKSKITTTTTTTTFSMSSKNNNYNTYNNNNNNKNKNKKNNTGYKRNLLTKNSKGFREKTEFRFLDVDGVVSTIVYGITKKSAVPNSMSVHSRNIWHNLLATTENINRFFFFFLIKK
jgi:hypothetical protein